MSVTEDMLIGDAIKQHPEAAQVMQSFGMPCVGCMVASGETIAEGASVHNIDPKELIEAINNKLDN